MADLIMQTENHNYHDRHIILLWSLSENQCVADNIKIHPTPSLLYLHMTMPIILTTWIDKLQDF